MVPDHSHKKLRCFGFSISHFFRHLKELTQCGLLWSPSAITKQLEFKFYLCLFFAVSVFEGKGMQINECIIWWSQSLQICKKKKITLLKLWKLCCRLTCVYYKICDILCNKYNNPPCDFHMSESLRHRKTLLFCQWPLHSPDVSVSFWIHSDFSATDCHKCAYTWHPS